MSPLVIILMLIVGAVLIYASVTGEDPRDTFKRALKRT